MKKRILFTLIFLILSIVSINNTFATIPVPTSQQFYQYTAAAAPVLNDDPASAMPVGVGLVATGGDTLSLQVGLNQFSGPVDIYLALYAPTIDPVNIYLIKSDNSFQTVAEGLTPWKENTIDSLNKNIFGNIPTSSLPSGKYYIYVVVAPTGNQDKWYIWMSHFTPLVWVRTGGPLGGLGYDVRMRPDNPDIMFVTDAWAGVFKSEDGGLNWFPSNQGINTRTGTTGDGIPIFCLTIDPNNPDIVWSGTQNQRGIFKSTDSGITWNKNDKGIVETDGITFRGIAIDPTNSDVIYAAAELSSWVWNNGISMPGREFDMTAGVVYKTTNGGEEWQAIWRGDNLARYIWINPKDPNIIYISTGIFDREAANSDPQAGIPGGEGVLKSTDGGKTWTNVNNGLNNLYVGSLFMHPLNPNILLAGTGNNQYYEKAGVYLTEDGGMSWEYVLSDDIINSVEFASSNPAIAYAGSSGAVYRSEDGGHSWQKVPGVVENGWGPPGVCAGFPIDFQVDLQNPDRLFANAYGGGNFLSEDGGKTWIVASTGYTGAQVRAINVDPTQPGRVIAAARSGIFVSNDGGINWEGLNFPPVVSLEWNAVAIDPSDPQHIIASTNWGNFLLNSIDGGYSWKQVASLGEQFIGWRTIAFASSDPKIVYAGSAGYLSAGSFDINQSGKGIYLSSNGGENWIQINDVLSENAHVNGLAVHPTNPKIVFAATTNHGLLGTTDGGISWKTHNDSMPCPCVALAVAINPINPNIVFVGMEHNGVFISTEGGQSWKHSSSGLNPEASISSIVFDPNNPLEVIYIADLLSGVYRSLDGGKTWNALNNSLSMRAINALSISSDGQHLYAASEGGGVFRLDLNGQPPKNVSN